MKYNIKYFASLREKAGKSDELLEGQFNNLIEVYDLLNNKYQFGQDMANLRASINGEYCQFEDQPHDGDTIVFIPPVAGG